LREIRNRAKVDSRSYMLTRSDKKRLHVAIGIEMLVRAEWLCPASPNRTLCAAREGISCIAA
ncbi:MAG: hypothetical protein ABI076_02295, partial [Acidobacteriaceae bacterium]